jgi:hypothetical protein
MPTRLAIPAASATAVTTPALLSVTPASSETVSGSGRKKPKALETMEITLTPCFLERPQSRARTEPEERERTRIEGEALTKNKTEGEVLTKNKTEDDTTRTEGQKVQEIHPEQEQEGLAKKETPEAGEKKLHVAQALVEEKEKSELRLPEENHIVAQSKDSRSVSLDSDLDLSEEEESDKDDAEDTSRSLAAPRLFSDSDHEELSDDERSHKRRRVERSAEDGSRSDDDRHGSVGLGSESDRTQAGLETTRV